MPISKTLMVKRITVSFIEVASEALLLGFVLAVILGYDEHAFIKDVLIYAGMIFMMFFTTGYVFTTAIVRAFWKGQKLWSYPVIAIALFLLHFEILNVGIGVAFEPKDRLRIRIAGAFIVPACTLIGGLFLQHATRTRMAIR